MLHALRPCNRVRTSHYTQIGSHEAHRCSGSLDIDFLWHVAQGIDDDLRIITVAQVLGQIPATAEGIDDESSVRDAFRCWQSDGAFEHAGSRKSILFHSM